MVHARYIEPTVPQYLWVEYAVKIMDRAHVEQQNYLMEVWSCRYFGIPHPSNFIACSRICGGRDRSFFACYVKPEIPRLSVGGIKLMGRICCGHDGLMEINYLM